MVGLLKIIYERRAVRKYKKAPVEKGLIDIILDAGRMAPSAMNKQPWKFYVLTDARKIKAFSKEIASIGVKELHHVSIEDAKKLNLSAFHLSTMSDYLNNGDHIFYGAPVVIFITSPVGEEWGAIDIGMCAQNMMLAAKVIGLDTCPVGFAKYITQAKDFYLLNIPDTEVVQLAIIVGFGDEQPDAHERIGNNATFI